MEYLCQCYVSTLLGLALLGVVLPPAAAMAVTDYMYHVCNPNNLSSNDNFVRNFNSVANSLIHNSSQFLYSLASSQTGPQVAAHVYGMYQCRADISLSDCSTCVMNGLGRLNETNSALSLCGKLAQGARVRYTGCYLRYQNSDFFNEGAVVQDSQDYEIPPSCTGSSNESSALYQHNLRTALQNSASAASKHAVFGYGASSVGSGSDTSYALTQCMGYLNRSQCATCLSQLVSNFSSVCNRSVSGQVYLFSCYYLFSNTPLLLTYENSLPSQAPTIAIDSSSPGKSREHYGNAPPPSQAPTIAIATSSLGKSRELYGNAPAIATDSSLPDGSKYHTRIILGVAVGVCPLLAIIVTVALCWLKCGDKAGNFAEIYTSQDLLVHADKQLLTDEVGARMFSLKELQDATDNFHANNKLGEGGFGPVYQGRLLSGMEVAIKMLSAQSRQGKAEFLNEVNLISMVKSHCNLIELIGCCVEGSKPLLVYEYLPNRSLNQHLFDVDENVALDWPTRFNIIMGISRGLRYLHEDSPVRIIHRDIKASNILLDNNLNPKIADFGLARLCADDRTHVTTRVAGTLGYLAPEYARSGKLTEKADVYSFGLVVLEIVSGRVVMDNKFEADEDNLLDWTWALSEKEQLLQIVDKRMQKTRDSSGTDVSMQVNLGEVIRVVHVALLCTQLQPQARPRMSEVYSMLCGQLEILHPPSRTSAQLKDLYNADPSSQVEPR